jgi:hypothetical protein
VIISSLLDIPFGFSGRQDRLRRKDFVGRLEMQAKGNDFGINPE